MYTSLSLHIYIYIYIHIHIVFFHYLNSTSNPKHCPSIPSRTTSFGSLRRRSLSLATARRGTSV